jgi:hypothetical protein
LLSCPEKGVLFHYIEGRGSVTMETVHMKFVYLVSASDVLSYAFTCYMTSTYGSVLLTTVNVNGPHIQ